VFCIFLIHEISAAITSMIFLLTIYLSIFTFQNITDFLHHLPIQPSTKRVKSGP
jgi:hypothetical protein